MIKRIYSPIIFILLTTANINQALAEYKDTLFSFENIDYSTFMKGVGSGNLAYTAEKFNIDIAEAEMMSATLFPDPEFEFGWYDNGHRRMKMGYGFEASLSWTIELGGKRKARINVAKDEALLKKLLLEDFFKNLRADATLIFLEAVINKMTLDLYKNSYGKVKELIMAQNTENESKKISVREKRVCLLEESILLNNLYEAEANWMQSLANLSLLLGRKTTDSLWIAVGELSDLNRDFDVHNLIITAQNNRTDLKVALHDKNLSKSLLALAQADRLTDIGVFVGVDYGSYVSNTIGPSAAFTSVFSGISIPLKFSNKRNGDLKIAQNTLSQSDINYQQTELEIQTEVLQTFWGYQSSKKQLKLYDTHLLKESEAVFEEAMHAYHKGESSLPDVIEAQKAYDEIRLEYYHALYKNAASLVELERAAGIWDIDF